MTNEKIHADGPSVAVVTVSYNSGRYLTEFLESTVAATSDRADLLVVVADNRSDDVDEVRHVTRRTEATFVDVGSNAGYGAAVNRAVSELPDSVRYVLVSNPDVVLSPGCLDVLRSTAEADDRIGAVGPAIYESDGSLYPSARAIPSLRTGLGHALFANIWPSNPWTSRYHREATPVGMRTTGWLSGACLLVRRDLFDDLEGFDPGYFMYFEDVDLGWRIGLSGHSNVYQPAARVVHVGAHSTRDSSDSMRREHHRSAYRFLARKYHAWWLWPLRLALRAGLVMRSRLHA